MRNFGLVALILGLLGCNDSMPYPADGGVCCDRWPKTIPGMPLAQSPSATPTFPVTIAPPYDGDPLSATQLRTDDLTPLQNGIEAARLLLYGGGVVRRVACTANDNMVIDPVGAVVLNSAGVWKTLPHLAVSIISPTGIFGAFANNTRYYVYAYDNAGVVGWNVSTDAPDATLRYKTANTSYMFLTTFYTDAAANIVPYTQVDHSYTYDGRSAGSVNGNCALWGGTADGLDHTQAYGGSVPSIARTVTLFAHFQAGAAMWQTGYIDKVTVGLGPGSTTTVLAANQGTHTDASAVVKQTLINDTNFHYVLAPAAGNQALYVWVSEFEM